MHRILAAYVFTVQCSCLLRLRAITIYNPCSVVVIVLRTAHSSDSIASRLIPNALHVLVSRCGYFALALGVVYPAVDNYVLVCFCSSSMHALPSCIMAWSHPAHPGQCWLFRSAMFGRVFIPRFDRGVQFDVFSACCRLGSRQPQLLSCV